jgi:hypothetical protein
LWSEKEAGRLWRARRQAQGGGRHRNGAPGEDVGSAGQLAALEAVVEGRGGEGVHKRPSCGVEGEARRGRPWRPWRARADTPQPPLYRHERRDATTLRERSVAGTRLPQGVCAGLGRNARQGKGADGPVVNSGCGRRRMRELHVAAQTSRAASVRATPWEDARPRRRGWCGAGEARAGARRRVLVPNCFTVPLFDCDFLPILQ